MVLANNIFIKKGGDAWFLLSLHVPSIIMVLSVTHVSLYLQIRT